MSEDYNRSLLIVTVACIVIVALAAAVTIVFLLTNQAAAAAPAPTPTLGPANSIEVIDLSATRAPAPRRDVRWLVLFIVACVAVGIASDVWRYYRTGRHLVDRDH